MEIIPFKGNLWKRQRRGYNRISPPPRKNAKIVKIGSSSRRSWRLKLTRKVRLMRLASPLKLWSKFKNAYMKVMLRMASSTGTSNTINVFGAKRIPEARDVPMGYTRAEFENRLILEIYKSMVASLELGNYVK